MNKKKFSSSVFLPQRDISWKLFGINGAVCWERPHVGWVKCNVDAVVFSSQSKISFGCVVRNSDGTFLAAIVLLAVLGLEKQKRLEFGRHLVG